MPKFEFTDPGGKTYEIDGPEGATQEQAFQMLQQHLGESAPKPAAAPPVAPAPKKSGVYPRRDDSDVFSEAGDIAAGAVEAGVKGVYNTGVKAAAGVKGIAKSLVSKLTGDDVSDSLAKGGQVADKFAEDHSVAPATPQGEAAASIMGAPMDIAAKLSKKAGGAIGGLAGPKGEAAGEEVGGAIPEVAATLLGGRAALSPTKPKAPMAGKDYSPLRTMPTEEADRFHSQKSQGIEPTKGSVTRDPSDVRFEQQMEQTPGEGARLLQRKKENEAALTDSVERLKQGTNVKGAKGLSDAETGQSVRTALEKKANAQMKEVDAKYEKARAAGETKEMVDLDPLTRYLDEHKAEALSVPKLNSVRAMVDDLKTMNKENPGHASIDQIESLRQRIGELAQGDGSVKKYMGDLRAGIDKMTEGKGGDLYKDARKARKEWGDEFEERVGVTRITDKSTRTDYKTAVEDVWKKSVVGGSIDELSSVVDSLRKSTGPQKAESAQALKEIAHKTLDHLSTEATKGGTFSPANLEKAMRSIGAEKLELLLGKDAVTELQKTVRNAKDVQTAPRRAPGSDTSLNQETLTRKLAAEHVDHLIKGALPRFAGRILDSWRDRQATRAGALKEKQAVDEALTPRRAPLSEIQKEADATAAGRRQYLMGEAGKRSAAQIPMASANIRRRDDE